MPDLDATPDGHILVADPDPTWAAMFERIRRGHRTGAGAGPHARHPPQARWFAVLQL